jgi:hypothetical protein
MCALWMDVLGVGQRARAFRQVTNLQALVCYFVTKYILMYLAKISCSDIGDE